MKPDPVFRQRVLLKKFPGKGGWTYAEIPGIREKLPAARGWLRVKGRIDGYRFAQYHLAPMGNGRWFLPVKSIVRKAIGKQAGDQVEVLLYPDDSPLQVPAELLECLEAEPLALDRFLGLSESNRKQYIDRIYAAKRMETRARRIAQSIEQLLQPPIASPARR